MGALMGGFDWTSTELGPPETWPQALRTTVRLLLNSGHPMYIWWGPRLLCFYNDAYRQSIGPERHPGSLGQPGREVWAEIWDIIGPQIDQVMAGGPPTWHENALVPITRNGRREDVYWTYSYSPIDDDTAANRVGGVLVQCAETTQSVLSEQRRAAQVERQQRLLQQAPGFIITMRGPDHIVEFVNDAHREVFGSDDWVGKPIRDAFPSIEGQGYFEELDKVYATGVTFEARTAPVRYERVRGAPADTRYMNFIYAPIYDEHGEISGIFCDGYDVTEVEAAAVSLQRSEEQLRLAVEAAEVGFWDVDIVNDLLFWPDRVKAMFGISPHVEVSMADFYAGLHPEDREATTAAFASATDPDQRAVYDVEYRTVGKEDGAVRWVAAKGKGVFEGDQCVRVIGTAIDVTTRKLAEARLRELNDTLEQRVADAVAERAEAEAHLRQAQKIEAVGQLTGGVAHDFNNLLMVIAGGLSLIDRPLSPERRQRIVDGMRQATERGASLSRQLLAFSRRQPLHAEPVNLSALIVGMEDLLDRTLRGDVHVRTVLSEDLWPIHVDPVELELAVLNLCVNARDAMPAGGTITISAENAQGDGIPGGAVRLTVNDTGSGMPPDLLARVFEPFFTTKEVGKGSGLGLPQVYGFAEQSGGSVTIDSTVGEGTAVTLMLPRSTGAPAGPGTQAHAARMQTARASEAVLLVEDDDEVATLVTEMLSELGYGVTRAASAEGALGALANERKVDLVLSDIMMAGSMNGVELAHEINRRRPGLPVLLTSGHAEPALRNAGFTVLAKPYDIQTLAHRLGVLINPAATAP